MTHKLSISLLALLGLIAMPVPAHAGNLYNSPSSGSGGGKTAPQTCDPTYWNALSARAWMEAEREIIQNKNLIFKPDSVMEYVCFDNFMQHGAQHLGDIFTHTTYFNGQVIIPRGDARYSLEQTLTKAVTNSYKTYITSNFGHKFLGERAAYMGGDVTADRTLGDASNMVEYGGKSRMECVVMSNIWNAAKCENFIHNSEFENDGFAPFDDITSVDGSKKVTGYKNMPTDPRKFPTACAKPSGNWAWDKTIPVATNENEAYKFTTPVKETYEAIRPKLEPGKCSGGASVAIATGVTVITDTAGTNGYADGVCPNPGCSFKKGSASGGTCAP